MSTTYHPAHNMLGHGAPLTEQLEVALFGVPVRYRSNSPKLITLTEKVLRVWRDLPPELIAPEPPAVVDLIVHPVGPADPPVQRQGRFVFRAHDDIFLAADGGNLLCAQMGAGRASAFLTPELLEDEPNLRHSVIECLGFLLANQRDRTPVHAAGIVGGERAILLAGRSTAGKSTLCYAAVRAGFRLLSEDTICVSLGGGPLVWGHPGAIHLLPDAPRFFPELAGLEPQVQANGKLKLAIDLWAPGAQRYATHAEAAVVCFVERAPGPDSRLDQLSKAEALAALADPREPGFDLFAERAPAVAAALVGSGAYRLSVGSELAGAVALLARLAAGTDGEDGMRPEVAYAAQR